VTKIWVAKLLAICLLGTVSACGGTTVLDEPVASGPPETALAVLAEPGDSDDKAVKTSSSQQGVETTEIPFAEQGIDMEIPEKPLTLDDFPDAIIDAFFNYQPSEKVLSLEEIRRARDEDEMASMAKKIGFTVEQIMEYTSPEPNYGERPLSDAVAEAFGRQESCAGQPMEPWYSCSPDGSKILTDTGRSSGCNSDLLIIRRDGSTERLTDNEFYMDRPVGWSQDGQEIFFTRGSDWPSSCAHSGSELWAISSDGTNEHRVGGFWFDSFNSWRPSPDVENEVEQEHLQINDPEGQGYTSWRTYRRCCPGGPRVEIAHGGFILPDAHMTIDQGWRLYGTPLRKSWGEADYWKRGAIREAVDAAAALAEEISTLDVERFRTGSALNGIGVDGFYLAGTNGRTRAFIFIGGGGKQGIYAPVAIYMPVLDCGGIGGVPQALLKWVLGVLQDFENDADNRQMQVWPYWNGSYSLDDQWGSRAAHVLAPLDWEPEFRDGCGSGSTTTWRKHSNPESNDRIRVHTGVNRGDWFETDGIKDSINPLYLPEGATVTRLSRTVFVYEIQDDMNVVGVWRVLGDDEAYTEATLHLKHRDTSFMNAFITHQLQVVAGTDLNYRVAE